MELVPKFKFPRHGLEPLELFSLVVGLTVRATPNQKMGRINVKN